MKSCSMRSLFLAVALLVPLMALNVGCATINPVGHAQTLEQKSYALYGSFVVFEEQAAKLHELSSTPERVKVALRNADAKAKPIADKLFDAVNKVLQIRLEVSAGTSTKEQLLLAVQNLDRYINEAAPLIQALAEAVAEAK